MVRTSKHLSLVLRHKPEKIGITLDPNGWVPVEELLAALARHGKPLSRDALELVVERNDKRRFAFSEDGTRIRASQGHSVNVDLALAPATPPEELYHGTVEMFLVHIRQEGLLPGSRVHVHLSADVETATRVGQRRGKPVILRVHAGRLHRDGGVFHLSDNGVWLTDHVPPDYLELP